MTREGYADPSVVEIFTEKTGCTPVPPASARTTRAPRSGLLYGYCLCRLRQEQNQHLAVPPDVAGTLP